jgi:hypothetical protein
VFRPEGSPRRRDHQRVVALDQEPDATRARARTVMQSAHAGTICHTWPAPIISVAVPSPISQTPQTRENCHKIGGGGNADGRIATICPLTRNGK